MYFQDLCEELQEKVIEVVKQELKEMNMPTDDETIDDYINRNNNSMQISEWVYWALGETYEPLDTDKAE